MLNMSEFNMSGAIAMAILYIEEQNEIVFYSVKETADYFDVCPAAINNNQGLSVRFLLLYLL